MISERRFWTGLILLATVGLVVYLLRGVLMPFVAGMLVAYFLDPLADRLERLGFSRTLATVTILATFSLVFVVVLVLLIPLLQVQVVGLVSNLPGYVEAVRAQLDPFLEHLRANIPPERLAALREAAGSYVGDALHWVGGLVQGALRGGMALLNVVSLVVITPLVAFYLLRDWDRIVARVDSLLPSRIRPMVREQASEIDAILAGFVRGQATVCLILGVFYAVGLSLVGLEFGIVVGLGTGLISFIPYFGMTIGLVTGMGIAFAQFSDWTSIGLVAAVFGAGQILEGNFITPKLVGDRVRLHPVWVIFAVLAGGSLFGFTGVMLALPAAAVIGVLVRFGVTHYRDSTLFERDGDPSA